MKQNLDGNENGIIETQVKLKEKEWKIIGKRKIWTKICPSCNICVSYTRKSALNRANREHRLCHKCSVNTIEFKKSISERLKGKPISLDHKYNIGKAMRERKITWGDKISKSLKGKLLTEKHIQKLKEAHKGMLGLKHSSTTINKMRNIKFGNNNPRYNIKVSSDIRKKQRISMLNYIKENRGELRCNVGKNETEILNNIESKTNSLIIRNYEIKNLGYIVDGYDKSLNIVYEIYEKYHTRPLQTIKDAERENEIKDFLKCSFKVIWDI